MSKHIIDKIAQDYLKDATPETIKYFKLALKNFGDKQRSYGIESACMIAEEYDHMSINDLRVSDLIRARELLIRKKEIRKNVGRIA